MSEIEKELVGASGFEPTKNYERQDYLAALARQINEIAEDEFDGLSVDAQEWFNSAVRAMNKKQELPEFPDVGKEGNGATDDEGLEAADEEPDPSDDEIEPEPETAPKPAKAKKAAKAKAPQQPPPPKVERELDQWGAGVNTQNHEALMMFEKGARMADVTEKIGGTYYNLLNRMVRVGHKVEKKPNGMIFITHMDKLRGGRARKRKQAEAS